MPDRKGIEECAALEEHSEPGEEGVPFGRALPEIGDVAAVHADGALVWLNKPQHAFQEHRLARARAADDHHAPALPQGQVHAGQNRVRAKGLMYVHKFDHAEKNSSVSTKLAARISTLAATTAPLVARPTPCAPRPDRMPK